VSVLETVMKVFVLSMIVGALMALTLSGHTVADAIAGAGLLITASVLGFFGGLIANYFEAKRELLQAERRFRSVRK